MNIVSIYLRVVQNFITQDCADNWPYLEDNINSKNVTATNQSKIETGPSSNSKFIAKQLKGSNTHRYKK